jgi:hypothetical protein
MQLPSDILVLAFQKASAHLLEPIVNHPEILSRVEYVCQNIQNRAVVRLLLACIEVFRRYSSPVCGSCDKFN